MSIWQTKKWQEMLLKSWQIEKYFEIDWIFIEKRSLWFKKFWLFCIWITKDTKIPFEKLKNLVSQTNSLFIQIENIDYNWELELEKNEFKNWFYKKFITPYTAIINLNENIENIYNEMKPKWRYNIKLAQKKWLSAQIVDKNDENIKKFHLLMQETTKRDWFSGNNFEYYKHFLTSLEESKLVFVCLWENILSAWIFVFYEKIWIYYYWASSSLKEFRNMMAPYLMQDFAIKFSIENWCEIYDFLWVKNPDEKKSSLDWVTDFKSKFTSNLKEVSRSYIFIENKFLFYTFLILKNLKKIFK